VLEREHELAEIEALLSAALAGTGRLLVIAGEAGIGKSTLLGAAVSRADERGLRVLAASGGALETEFAYGVARQLFGGTTELRGAAAAPALGLADAGRAGSFELQHGLYWLTSDLADAAPLLVAVDDVQWADPDSLGFLAYLARRLDDLRVALLLAVREGEPCPAPEILAGLRAGGRELVPAPLSEEAVRSWLGDGELAAACYEACGGNPFLLHALLERALEEVPSAGTLLALARAERDVGRFEEALAAADEPLRSTIARELAELHWTRGELGR
jgi:hypothetical protein